MTKKMFVESQCIETRAIHKYSESQWCFFFLIFSAGAISWRMEIISTGRNEREYSK